MRLLKGITNGGKMEIKKGIRVLLENEEVYALIKFLGTFTYSEKVERGLSDKECKVLSNIFWGVSNRL